MTLPAFFPDDEFTDWDIIGDEVTAEDDPFGIDSAAEAVLAEVDDAVGASPADVEAAGNRAIAAGTKVGRKRARLGGRVVAAGRKLISAARQLEREQKTTTQATASRTPPKATTAAVAPRPSATTQTVAPRPTAPAVTTAPATTSRAIVTTTTAAAPSRAAAAPAVAPAPLKASATSTLRTATPLRAAATRQVLGVAEYQATALTTWINPLISMVNAFTAIANSLNAVFEIYDQLPATQKVLKQRADALADKAQAIVDSRDEDAFDPALPGIVSSFTAATDAWIADARAVFAAPDEAPVPPDDAPAAPESAAPFDGAVSDPGAFGGGGGGGGDPFAEEEVPAEGPAEEGELLPEEVPVPDEAEEEVPLPEEPFGDEVPPDDAALEESWAEDAQAPEAQAAPDDDLPVSAIDDALAESDVAVRFDAEMRRHAGATNTTGSAAATFDAEMLYHTPSTSVDGGAGDATFSDAAAFDAEMSHGGGGGGDGAGSSATPPLPPPPPPPDATADLFGGLIAESPAFRKYTEERIIASRPIIDRIFASSAARDWQFDFGPISAPAGNSTTITVRPQCLFRGEKTMATDTGSPNGWGTRITQIAIGRKIQRPAAGRGASTLTAFFASSSLGNGILWDTCHEAYDMAVSVSFVQACTFHMTIFGRAVIDE